MLAISKDAFEKLKKEPKVNNQKRNEVEIIKDSKDEFHSIWNNLVREEDDDEEGSGWGAWCGYHND